MALRFLVVVFCALCGEVIVMIYVGGIISMRVF